MELIFLPCALTIVFATVFIIMRTNKKTMPSLVFKTLAGVGFLSTGVVATYLSGFDNYALFALFGLILGLCGDVIMQFKYFNNETYKAFLAMGMGFFAIGHFFYLAAVYTVYSFSILALIIGVALALTVLAILSQKEFERMGKLRVVCPIYYLLLSFIVAQTAFGYIGSPTTKGLVLLIGMLAFFLSDSILGFIYFKVPNKRIYTVINLVTYYIAQLCIALSIML